MLRERVLKIVLVLVGLLFSAAIYPVIGGLLDLAHSDTGDTMMLGLYRPWYFPDHRSEESIGASQPESLRRMVEHRPRHRDVLAGI